MVKQQSTLRATAKPSAPSAKIRKPDSKKAQRRKARLLISTLGQVSLDGRPDFPTATKKIKVNQSASKGDIEDRRHILHWDEQLKPLFERVINAMKTAYPTGLLQALQKPLRERKWRALPANTDELILRIAKELNGAMPNLVADRADINKAIEHVRGYARKYMEALTQQTHYASDCLAGDNHARMQHYKQLARTYFPTGRNDTPINSRTSEIHDMVLKFIDGSPSPSHLWILMNDIIFSVTFDLSAKALREQTSASLAWLSRMLCNGDKDAAEQYEDMLTLLD
jgi:hypothetical protein